AAGGQDPPAGDGRGWGGGGGGWADDAGLDHPRAGGAGGRGGGDDGGGPATRMVQSETLRGHLSWQLHLSHLSPRDLRIGAVLVDAIEDDGYLRVPYSEIAAALAPEPAPGDDEILAVLRQIQRMDPVGVGARDLAECLWIQLDTLPEDTPGRALAITLATTLIDRLPRLGVRGVCEQLGCTTEEAETALALLRSLDPRPGSQVGELPSDSYVVPDAVIVRRNGVWQAMLAPHSMP